MKHEPDHQGLHNEDAYDRDGHYGPHGAKGFVAVVISQEQGMPARVMRKKVHSQSGFLAISISE